MQAIAARRLGEGRPPAALHPLHGALVVAAVAALPFALVLSTQTEAIFRLLSDDPEVIGGGAPYLRIRLWALAFVVCNFSFRGYWSGIGRTTVYLRTILLIHAVNIFLNWVLIYGNLGFPQLGVEGAAIASAVAVAVGTLTYSGIAWRQVDGFLRRGGLPAGTFPALLRLSVPAGIQSLFLSAGYLLFYRIAQELGTAELAATNVLVNLALVCILPAMGFGLAAATLVGESLGAGQPREASRWAWSTVAIATVTMLLLGLTLAVAPRLWLSLLMKDPTAEVMAVVPLILLGLLQPVDGVGLVLSHALIGAGAVRPVTVASVALQWGLFLPGAYLAAVHLGGGLLALWIALGIWRALFSGVMVLLFSGGRWAEAKV